MTPTPEQAIRNLLINDADFSALTTSVYCQPLAPSDAPTIHATMQRVSGSPTRHMTNASALAYARIQVNYWHGRGSGQWLKLRDLVEKARLALDAYRGSVTIDGTLFYISHTQIENESDLTQEPTDGGEDLWLGMSHDILMGYKTSTPTR